MTDKVLKEQLATMLKSGMSHMGLGEAVKDFPSSKMNSRAPNVDYTFWHIVEHIRLTQRDILEFIRNPKYQEPSWPKDYWPDPDSKATAKDWKQSIALYDTDLRELVKMAKDPKADLEHEITWGDGQTVLRELLLVADHNSYHIGEIAILRQVCNLWPKGRK